MNSLVLLPLLAAACVAAPGGLHHTYAAAPAVVAHAAPAAVHTYTAHVQVPVQQTVHYDVKNVVTGYTSQIIKPAIAAHTVPVLPAPAVVPAPAAPVVVAEQQPVSVVQPVAPVQVAAPPAPAPAPVEVAAPASDDTVLVENPEFRSAVYAAAPAPAVHTYAAAPAVHTYAAAPAVHTYAAPAVHTYAAPAVVRAAPHFDHLVTKEKVLAPVRTHTQLTPQVTQIQPEVTVRKVIQDVGVDTPVYHTPVVHKTHVAPAQVHHQTYVAPAPAVHYAAAPALVQHHHAYAAPAPVVQKIHY